MSELLQIQLKLSALNIATVWEIFWVYFKVQNVHAYGGEVQFTNGEVIEVSVMPPCQYSKFRKTEDY